MSHFTKIRTQYSSRESIIAAIKAMGFACNSKTEVPDEEADNIVIPATNSGGYNNLYFERQALEKAYLMNIYDEDRMYGHCTPGQGFGKDFIQQFTKQYSIAQIEANGQYVVTGEELLGTGEVRLVVEPRVTVGAGISSAGSGVDISGIGSWVV